MKLISWLLCFFLMASLLLLALQNSFTGTFLPRISYSDFKSLLKDNQINEVILGERFITSLIKPDRLQNVLPKAELKKVRETADGYRIAIVRVNDPTLLQELDTAKIRYAGQIENKWAATLLSWLIPIIIIFALWSFLMRRNKGAENLAQISRSRAKIYNEKLSKISFQDVAGVDEAKAELKEVVEFLTNPKAYHQLGARLPKGILLVGPPGTGKTLLARAVAGEAQVPFFSINGSEFVEMFVGVGAARVRDLFIQAQAKAPAIIFIDELDALGRARSAAPVGGNDEKEHTLNQLLSEMDGFDSRKGLVLLAATNRPEILDSALLRAGRFDRQVLVDRPDKIGRKQILTVHLKRIVCDDKSIPEKIAALTPGFTGADLANLVNEAALLAVRRKAKHIDFDDFMRAIERIIAGLEKKNRLLNEKERTIVAYHEVGHALVALCLPDVDTIQKISIIPRGIKSLGYTIQRPTEDRYLMTEKELQMKMIVLLGGRAAELVIFNHLSTGAADDLAKVTEIARSMVMRYGMNDQLGHVIYESETASLLAAPLGTRELHQFSEKTAEAIDHAVREITKQAFDQAISIIKNHRPQLEHGAKLLLQKETLDEKEILSLMPEKNKTISELV